MTPGMAFVIALLSLFVGSGGVYAWFKLGPERRQFTITAAQGAVVIHSDVLKDLKAQYDSVSEELTLLKMENTEIEAKHSGCREEISELRTSVVLLQRDLDRHGKISFLARRKTHVAVHAIGAYELLIDQIFTDLRERPIPIKPEWRPTSVRASFQAEMDKLEELEAQLLQQAINVDPPGKFEDPRANETSV